VSVQLPAVAVPRPVQEVLLPGSVAQCLAFQEPAVTGKGVSQPSGLAGQVKAGWAASVGSVIGCTFLLASADSELLSLQGDAGGMRSGWVSVAM